MSAIFKLGAVVAALLSVLVGLVFFSSILKEAGVYRWHAENYSPYLIGLTPAQHYGLPWRYTFEDLYKSDLSGQTAIVTGANSGIGYQAALALARLGAQVTLACRNPTKCQSAAEKMRLDPQLKGDVRTKTMDTNSLASVRKFAEDYKNENPNQALDILMLNAGTAYAVPSERCVPTNDDGVEHIFASNYLGHHLLYRSLEDRIQKSKMARVVQTSSCESFNTYSYGVATDLETLNGCSQPFLVPGANLSYGQSKLAQIVWVKKVSRMLSPSSTIYVNAFHPGAVDTGIWEHIMSQVNPPKFVLDFLHWMQREVMWTPQEGALTGLFLSVNTAQLERDDIRGKYYHPMAQEVDNPLANDQDLQDRLWDFSEELIKEFLPTFGGISTSPLPEEEEQTELHESGLGESAIQEDKPDDHGSEKTESSDEVDSIPEEITSHISPTEQAIPPNDD